MAKPKRSVIEYRNYNLPTYFPVLLLSGDVWRISDVRSDHLHFHNCLEIGLCESDSGIMEFGDVKKHFKDGDVTLVGTDVAHTTYSDPGTASKWSYIFLDLEELLAPYFPLNLFVDTPTFNGLIHNYYEVYDASEHIEITNLVRAMVTELTEKKENFQFSVRGLALSLLVHVLNNYKKSEASFQKGIQGNSEKRLVIAPALDYIHTSYMNEFMIDDLADICEMSPTHFRRTFQAIMGTSPLDYLNGVRISKASVLLRSTELPVLTISEEVGFRSVSSFNRHFTEVTGTSPLKWRKQMSFIENKSVLKYTGWMVPER